MDWLISILPFVAIGLLFYYLLIRPKRQEQSRWQAMLATVKKNDRVITAGGIYGVVTNVHREADEVTIKVDEATNTKLRVTLSSIARILGDEPSDESSSK
jgi:preprotein translocase subunit YajC